MANELLAATRLAQDDRVHQARALLAAALEEHSSGLNAVRPPRAELAASYSDTLARFGQTRGGTLFYPYIGSGLGNGVFVELADGSVKYDMITGIGVHVFGHSDAGLLEAGLSAVLSDTVMQGNLQQNIEPVLFSRELVETASESGARLDHCFLSTSGATANENALKLLFQARQPANRLLAFRNGFAGRTMVLSQVTDRPQNRVGLPTTLAVDYVPFFNSQNPQASIDTAIQVLREHVARYPGMHAGMMIELVQGEGGYYAAPREFFAALCTLLRELKIPIVFDEIQTFGRTTRPFAFQHFALDGFADVVSAGKMTQVCATLFRDELVPKPGLVSQTFTGATASLTAARSILHRLRTGGYFGPEGRNMEVHRQFVQHFESLYRQHPRIISGPWGLGGMIAFTPFDGSAEITKKVMDTLFAAGVITFVAGDSPKRIRMLPPLGIISNDDIAAVCGIVKGVLMSLL